MQNPGFSLVPITRKPSLKNHARNHVIRPLMLLACLNFQQILQRLSGSQGLEVLKGTCAHVSNENKGPWLFRVRI